jgi:hypothetical protein
MRPPPVVAGNRLGLGHGGTILHAFIPLSTIGRI